MQRYEILERLGDGTYGSVWKGKHRKSGNVVAIKTLKRKFTSWEECVSLRELESLRSLPKNPNIVQIKELIREDDSQLHFVFEYMPDGNLYQMMKERIEKRSNLDKNQGRKSSNYDLAPDTIKSIAMQVLKGLAHIHSLGFIHRDIKPENLLLHGNTCKIADFGLARQPRSKPNSPALTEYISTRWYRAPEVLLKSPKYSAPIDVFAVGCVIAEMVELKPLFPGASEIDQIHKVFTMLGQPTHFNWPEGIKLLNRKKFPIKTDDPLLFYNDHRVDENVLLNLSLERSKANLAKAVPSPNQITLSFLHKLLMINPNNRPSAKEAMVDPFFSSGENVDPDKMSHETYDLWVSGGQKSKGLTTSTPYLEAEAARHKKRNKSRSIPCADSGPFPMHVPMNSRMNNVNVQSLTNFDYQHTTSIGSNSVFGTTFQSVTPPISDDPSYLHFKAPPHVADVMQQHNPFARYNILGINGQMEP